MFFLNKRIHFLGIGGAGMCPLAEVMHINGQRVTGSDELKTDITIRLESLGIGVQYNHAPDLVKGADLIVYSSAIKPDNEELVYAKNQGITCMKRSEVMGDIMRAMFCIGIAGTHGKTTTTSLIGNIFWDAEKDPTVIVGGVFVETNSNAIAGESRLLITEADEFDRSFLNMYPTIAVVTGVEADHLDTYGNIENLKQAFVEYLRRLPFYGLAVICADDKIVMALRGYIDTTTITYGTSGEADYSAAGIKTVNGRSLFNVLHDNKDLGEIDIPLIGVHNVRNALAAIAVSCEMEIPFDIIQISLKGFKGIKRRFEYMGSEKEITVIDDYAHHPTEIRASLQAARDAGYKRIIAVFQPHLYSRTKDFCDDFAHSLSEADYSIVTGIYKARDDIQKGISGSLITDKIREMGVETSIYIEEKYDVAQNLVPLLQPEDCIILMGAGDIWEIGEELLREIKNG